MKAEAFIAGDWGTSNLRLFLVDQTGRVLDERNGPGAAEVQGGFAAELASLSAAWRSQHGALPVILCGMVGSSLGWMETRALPCPENVEAITAHCSTPAEGVRIVPGLCCVNRYGAADFMRGEETQILGALKLAAASPQRRLLCLPGTHSKWVIVEGLTVREFVSAPTGEVFKVLREHSVLVREHHPSPLDPQAFAGGLAAFALHPRAQLLHRLFEARSRQLTGELNAAQAAGFLSGLLIASDTAGGLELLAAGTRPAVTVIGAPSLTALYAKALRACGVEAIEVDGVQAALAGLLSVQRHFLPQALS